MASKHNYYRSSMTHQRQAAFQQPAPRLNRASAFELVAKTGSLEEAADAIAARLGPEANAALAQRAIFRAIRRRP
jgi:hypothetical protein